MPGFHELGRGLVGHLRRVATQVKREAGDLLAAMRGAIALNLAGRRCARRLTQVRVIDGGMIMETLLVVLVDSGSVQMGKRRNC